MKRIYLAAPFFNPQQLERVESVERLLIGTPGVSMYSPRSDGVLKDMTPKQRTAAAPDIFAKNVDRIRWADAMVAILDDKDEGTQWELGRMYQHGPIIGMLFTARVINVMALQGLTSLARSRAELATCLRALVLGDELPGVMLSPDVI